MNDQFDKVLKVGEVIKLFGGWVFGIVALVISIIFWIQTQGNDKFYPRLAGENLEKQLVKIEQHMDVVQAQNMEMIRILGHIEGSASK